MTVEKQTCPVCNREIDKRGMSGHMKTHKKKVKEIGENDVISYPANGEAENNKTENGDIALENEKILKGDGKAGEDKTTNSKKRVNKSIGSNSTSKPASNLTAEGAGHRSKDDVIESGEEYQGLFR